MVIVFCWPLRRLLIALSRLRWNGRRSRRMQRLIVSRPSRHVPLQSIVVIRNLYYSGLTRFILMLGRITKPVYRLNIRVIRIERRLFRFRGWIGKIWVHVRFECLGNTKSMVLCEFDLGCCLSIQRTPYLAKIQECCSCLESICRLSRYLVCFHGVVCSLESFLTKLLDVRLTGHIIHDSIVVREVRFSLLELVHEGHGVRHAVRVCFVELLGQDLLNDPVIAPVCHGRFGLFHLASPLGESSYVCCLQGRWDSCSHLFFCSE